MNIKKRWHCDTFLVYLKKFEPSNQTIANNKIKFDLLVAKTQIEIYKAKTCWKD